MKLTQNTSPVEISGAVSTPSNFSIATSKEAFKILSSGLYTNKIRAIIRELSCNAFDAHVAAGKADVAFSVHLPTSFEPFFSIKDQGTGLEYRKGGCKPCGGTGSVSVIKETATLRSGCETCGGSGDYDAVRILYCTYFATNKSDSNLFVGALGLGSKSPFCYTEGFSVTNVYDGMTRIYSCFINEKGMPTVLLQTQEETVGATNGVEVSFPVKQNDVWEFENQAKYVWEFFNPQPEHNLPSLVINQAEYSLRTERWGLRKTTYRETSAPRAIQGMVQYSVGEIDESRLTYEQQKLVELPLDLFFPIGELSVAASRESLSNDEATVLNILKALDSVKDELLDDVKKQILACKTYWEARLLIYNLSNTGGGLGRLVSSAFTSGAFNDLNPEFTLSSKRLVINQRNYPNIAIREFNHSSAYGRVQAKTSLLTKDLKELPEASLGKPIEIEFSVEADVLFVINDLGFGVEKFIHYMLQQDHDEPTETVYFITRANKDVESETVVDCGARLVIEVGMPPAVLMSEIKAKYKDIFSSISNQAWVPKKFLQLKESAYTGSGAKGWTKAWKDATNADLPEGIKYYVPVKSQEPQTGKFGKSKELQSFVADVRNSKQFGFGKGDVLYGIPFWHVSKLDSSWVELTSHVLNSLPTVITPAIEMQVAFYSQHFDSGMNLILEKISKNKLLAPDSPLQQFCDNWAAAKRYEQHVIEALDSVLSTAQFMGQYQRKTGTDFSLLWSGLKKIYPLLNIVSKGHRYTVPDEKETVRAITQYAMLIDQENKRFEIVQSLITGVVQIEEEENVHVN